MIDDIEESKQTIIKSTLLSFKHALDKDLQKVDIYTIHHKPTKRIRLDLYSVYVALSVKLVRDSLNERME